MCQAGSKEIQVHYPHARLTLYIEALLATLNYPVDVNTALATVIGYIQNMPPGHLVTFGYAPSKNGMNLTTTSKNSPRVYMALQYITRNKFHIQNAFAVRVGTSIQKMAKSHHTEADVCTSVPYPNDRHPDFHHSETNETVTDVYAITHTRRTRVL